MRVWRVELVFSASEMCIAPSAPMALSHKLPTGVERKEKQTSGGADGKQRVCGGVLEEGEGLVLLQALRKVLGALCAERI